MGIRGRTASPSKADFCKICSKSLLCLCMYFTSGGSVAISCTAFFLRWAGGSCLLLQITHQVPNRNQSCQFSSPNASSFPDNDMKIRNKIKPTWFIYSLRLVYGKESLWNHALLGSHHDAKLNYTRKTCSTNVKNYLHHCGIFLFKSHFISWGQYPYTSVFVMITSPCMHSFLTVKEESISSSADFPLLRSSWTLGAIA